MKTQEAIEALYDGDHQFFNREHGENICHSLGVKPPKVQCETVDPTAIKGLSVPGKKKGDKVFGYDARHLADWIAFKLNSQFQNPCFGRGFGLRFAVKFIEDTLAAKGA
jgi:hypothetical protein